MIRQLCRIVAALTIAISGARVDAQAPQPVPDTQMPSALSLPPALDRVLRDYEAAWRDGDGDRLAALFTEDGFAVQSGSPIRPDGPRSRGRDGRWLIAADLDNSRSRD